MTLTVPLTTTTTCVETLEVKCRDCRRTVVRVADGVLEVRMRHDSEWHVTRIPLHALDKLRSPP